MRQDARQITQWFIPVVKRFLDLGLGRLQLLLPCPQLLDAGREVVKGELPRLEGIVQPVEPLLSIGQFAIQCNQPVAVLR